MKQRRDFGTVRRRGSTYQIRYTGPDGTRYAETVPAGKSRFSWGSKEQDGLAYDRLSEIAEEIDAKQWKPPAAKKKAAEDRARTVGAWVDEYHDYLEKHGLVQSNTLKSYRTQAKKRINEATGDAGKLAKIPITKVTKKDFLDWWDAIIEQFPTNPASNKLAYDRLNASMNRAVKVGHIPMNPIDIDPRARKYTPKDKKLADKAELQLIVDNIVPYYKLAAVLILFHGMRIGEALALRVSDVHGNKDSGYYVTIDSQFQRLDREDGKLGNVRLSPKTASGYRAVNILPEFWELLETHLEKYAGEELLTLNRNGKSVEADIFRSAFHTAKKKAGLKTKTTPHYGRNWLNTELATLGATPQEIGKILGQSDLRTIIETYMKVKPERPRQLMDQLSERAFGSGSGSEAADNDN